MALVNPNIAMSFRQPEFTPRNAMAEYAQMQKVQMDDMTLQRLQEDRAGIMDLRAKLRAAGQSDDPQVFFKVLKESDNPDLIAKGIEGEQRYKAVQAYDREFGPRAGAPAMPSSAPNAMVAPSTPAPRVERGVDAYGKPFEAEVGGGIATPGAMGQPLAPLGAAAPVAPAAPVPAPVNAMAPSSAMPDVNALRRQYGMAVAAGRSDAPVLLEQIKAALRGEQNKPLVLSRGQVVFDPQNRQQIFAAESPTPTMSDRFVPVGKFVFDRQNQVFVSPSQAQLAQSQEQPAAASTARGAAPAAPSASAGKPPTPAQVAKDKRMEEARTALSKDIETQLGYYQELADTGAMTSPKRSVGANVLAYARSSGPGQEFERAAGTPAQTLRDNIKNTRQRLFMQIKDATGATASQMNSNAEMQAWLNSMTDPQQSIETVQETLKQMDSVIAGVRRDVEREQAGKKPPAKSAPAASGASNVTQDRADANAAIAAGASADAVRARFKQRTGQEL